jgi:MFS family permease
VRLLRGRDFRLLVMSSGLSALGDELALIALTIKVFDLSHSGFAVSALLLAGIAPLVVFSPLAGLLVDRTETTGTLAIASLIQAGIAVGLAYTQSLPLLIGLSFLLGSVAAVASPAVYALVPSAVDEKDLTPANAGMETARYAGMIVGPIAAAALSRKPDSPVALVVDAVTFLVIASSAASLTIRRPPEAKEGEARQRWGQARQGFSFIRRDRVLLIGVAVISFTVLFAVMDNVAEIFFARDPTLLDAGNWGYGALAACWLVGMVAGATLIARRLPDERLTSAIVVASIVGGSAVAVAAAFPNVALALSLFVVGGMANGVGSVSIRSLIHHRVPDRLRGRVFAAFFGVANAGQIGATALGGVLVASSAIGPQRTLLTGGVGGAVVGAIGLTWYATLPRRAKEAVEDTIRIPDVGSERRAADVVEVRNITLDEVTATFPGEGNAVSSDDHAGAGERRLRGVRSAGG